jgi:mannose-1-phosphate guanylyltransferase
LKIVNVILSGGVGSRLWPLSRKSRPKQYLPIFENQSLFQKTVSRNQNICDQILIIGNVNNYSLSRNDLDKLGQNDFLEIIEACPRNTAAAIAFAAFATDPDDVLFISPSDHLIEEGVEYFNKIKRGIELAKQGFIVTFGLKPTKAETGFGYIEANGEEVKSFREKPDLKTAESFVRNGNFFWNSGMFCFQSKIFLQELKTFEPEVYQKAKLAYGQLKDRFLPKDLSLEIPSISVDYAVMERTKKIKVVPSDFIWSDMGSFESIYDFFLASGHPIDEYGNMIIGSDRHLEFIGLSRTIFVQTEDAFLILQKEKAQEVKKVYERLEKEKPNLV